jgi:hypothetical protein
MWRGHEGPGAAGEVSVLPQKSVVVKRKVSDHPGHPGGYNQILPATSSNAF